ncbi:MAG: MlaD family protein [Candidatus Kapaibacteriota bacterium]|jgi:phospholipid/cholesterol/gamma-HCH transport system substrate-binding protein
MKNIKKIEFKVGIVSFFATVILIAGLILGRGYKVSVSTQTIKFRFPNSGGLQTSSPVVVNGVKRGTVSSIQNDNGSVFVTATIDNVDDFRKDVRAKITILEITGGKKIEISPGSSNQPFDINSEIPGETAPDFADIVADLGFILSDAKQTIKHLDSTLSYANKFLADKNFINTTKAAIENANQTLLSMRQIFEANHENINQTLRTIREITSQLRNDYSKYEPKVNRLVDKLEKISNETQIALDNGNLTIQRLDTTVSHLNQILNEIRNGRNLANKLIYDSELATKLDSTITNLSNFITIIQKYGVNVNLRIGTRP